MLEHELIELCERSTTSAASVLRRSLYRFLERQHKTPVGAIRAQVQMQMIAERQARAQRAENTWAKMIARVARIDELQARVMGGPAKDVRERLAENHGVRAIANVLGIQTSYVTAVRDLDHARATKPKLTQARKEMPRKLRAEIEAIRNRPGWTSAPTPEWRRQLGIGEEPEREKVVGDQYRHRKAWPIDKVRDLMSFKAYAAAERVRDAYYWAHPQSRIASYDGYTTGGNPADRTPMTPVQEKFGREFKWFWSQLPGTYKWVVQNFVLGQPRLGRDRPLSRVEFGRAITKEPSLSEPLARRQANIAILLTCEYLAHLEFQLEGAEKLWRRRIARAAELPHIQKLLVAGATQEAAELVVRHAKVEGWFVALHLQRAAAKIEAERRKHLLLLPGTPTAVG